MTVDIDDKTQYWMGRNGFQFMLIIHLNIIIR